MAKSDRRKFILVMDNCSAHGSVETLCSSENVEKLFLPPNSTGRLQPLDAGIIPGMTVRYHRRQMEHAFDLLDVE